jgi:hypothetical protein
MEYVDDVRLNMVDEMMETEFVTKRKVAAATNISPTTAYLILKEQLGLWQKVGKKPLITPEQEVRRVAMCQDILKRGEEKFGDNFYDNIIFTDERYKNF